MLTEPGEPSSTKARLFGEQSTDELRRRVAKARFLQALGDHETDDHGGELTRDDDGEGTEPSAASLEVERVRVGRFAVLRKLGQGGMGVVYAAYDEDLDRKVALKLIRQDLARDERGRVRMQREAQALARLSHPNVVQVHEIGRWGEHDYVAMEFVSGQTLGQWLESRERSWAEVLDVMIQAGRGLLAAHQAQLVHRDFKPANLMVGEDGRARVLDFGLARAATAADSQPGMPVSDLLMTDEQQADDTQASAGEGTSADRASLSGSSRSSAFDRMLTATGALLGTPAYMSPEQHLGQSATALSDQFSFCVVLYEGLFGERPYRGNRYAYAAQVTEGEFVVPGPNSGVPAWLRKAVCRGLATKPADRWPSMDALLAELTRDRRRLWTRVGVAAGFVAALTAGLALAEDDRGPLCESEQFSVVEVWGPTTHEAVRKAITATGHERATQRLAEVEHTLDHYAEALVAARTSSCGDRWIEQTQTEAQYSLRAACLDQRERELAAIVEVLAQADADTVERVPGILASVGDIDLCARVELLERNVPVPKDAAAIATIAEVRKDLARGHVARQAGQQQAAELFAKDARARADELGYVPLIGEVAYLEGANAFRRRDDQQAETALLEAAGAATRIQDLSLQAQVALLDAQTVLRMGGRASYQIAVAEAAVEQLGEARPLQVELHVVRALALREAEQPEAALAQLARAVELMANDYPGRDHQLAGVLVVRAGSHSLLGQQAQAREDLQRALALGLDPDSITALDAVFDLGTVEVEDQNYAEAEALINLALAGYERVYGSSYAFIGYGQLALAQIDIEGSNYDAAEQHIERAREVLDEQHPDHSAVLVALAALERDAGRFEPAIDQLERALLLAQGRGDAVEVGDLQFQLGYTLVLAGRHERALALLDQSIAALDGDPVLIVRPLIQRGQVLRLLGRLESSLESLERAVQLLPVEAGRPLFATEAHIELALTLELMGQLDRARVAARTAQSRIADDPDLRYVLDPIAKLLVD